MEIAKVLLENIRKKRKEIPERGVNCVQLREMDHNYFRR